MDEEDFQKLRQADWGEISKTLLAVAINWARKYPSLRRYGANPELALGKTCGDIVQDVIVKTLRGDRKWDSKKGKLLPWLIWCVKSEIDRLARKKATNKELLLIDQDRATDDLELQLVRQHSGRFAGGRHPSDPESVLLQQEQEEATHQKVIQLYEIARGDEESHYRTNFG
ncbi:MAG: hypothetical protein L0332_28105 [Chloroflexi bacterium]|nr:hypothetical protein [Chloroflexota bacterium]